MKAIYALAYITGIYPNLANILVIIRTTMLYSLMVVSGHPFSNGVVHVHFLDFEVAIANFHLVAVMRNLF